MKEKKARKKPNFSKCIVLAMIGASTVVLVFAMAEMHRQNDLSSLSVLIGATVSEVIGLGVFYLKKSQAENTVGGITYDTAMKEIENARNAVFGEDENLKG